MMEFGFFPARKSVMFMWSNDRWKIISTFITEILTTRKVKLFNEAKLNEKCFVEFFRSNENRFWLFV